MSRIRTLALCDHNHNECIDKILLEVESICKNKGLRFTKLRKNVLELVWESHQPIGAYTILQKLMANTDNVIKPPTVYRALDFLLEYGFVHRVCSFNAFVGCPRPGDLHSCGLFICLSCKNAHEIEDLSVQSSVESYAKKIGFSTSVTVLEVSGICSVCNPL